MALPEDSEAELRAIEAMPPPPKEFMAKMQPYMRAFCEALEDDAKERAAVAMNAAGERGARAKGADKTADDGMMAAVFKMTGWLVDWARSQVEGFQPAPAAVRGIGPVTRSVKGARGADPPDQPLADTLMGAITTRGDVRVVLEYHKEKRPDGKEKMTMVLKVVRADNTPVRPFDVEVRDDAGQVIAARETVVDVMKPARWPSPRPGVYVFDVRWESGAAELRVQVVA